MDPPGINGLIFIDVDAELDVTQNLYMYFHKFGPKTCFGF